ncbi:hypothetical protein IV417_03250 [Alphaproteobacteria bacterium KMM 3653]|uniref:Uncharacterized protein n=1 Tax=Harenicola maris TaxID=2841044 RepID=A0AAP2CPZ1_9RHOB|nr:hypothetical protein [Harenicola maris]
MATKLSPQMMEDVLCEYLEPGESLRHMGYAVNPPNLLIVLPLFVLAVLPGAIAYQVMMKHYIVGTTDSRLIAVRFKPSWKALTVKAKEMADVVAVPFAQLSAAKTKARVGKIFTVIRSKDLSPVLHLKFHRAYSKTNRPESAAMVEQIKGATGQ